MERQAQPVTLGALRRAGQCIEVRCIQCSHGAFLDCKALPQPDDFPFPDLQNVFRCTRCGNRNGEQPGWHYVSVWIGERARTRAGGASMLTVPCLLRPPNRTLLARKPNVSYVP